MPVSWPEVVLLALVIVRQELDRRELRRHAEQLEQQVSDATVVVRRDDSLPHESRAPRGHREDDTP